MMFILQFRGKTSCLLYPLAITYDDVSRDAETNIDKAYSPDHHLQICQVDLNIRRN